MYNKLLYGGTLQRKILRSINKLPPMPNIVHKAREIIQNPNAGINDLGKIIGADQALTINVLKTANSAYYRRVAQATSIQNAAVVLGIKTIGELITLSCTSPVLSKTLKGYDI